MPSVTHSDWLQSDIREGAALACWAVPLCHTGTLPPHSSVSPPQLTAYLHRATAYKDMSTQRTFNQVQMRYTGKQSVLILCAL